MIRSPAQNHASIQSGWAIAPMAPQAAKVAKARACPTVPMSRGDHQQPTKNPTKCADPNRPIWVELNPTCSPLRASSGDNPPELNCRKATEIIRAMNDTGRRMEFVAARLHPDGGNQSISAKQRGLLQVCQNRIESGVSRCVAYPHRHPLTRVVAESGGVPDRLDGLRSPVRVRRTAHQLVRARGCLPVPVPGTPGKPPHGRGERGVMPLAIH